MTGKKNTPMRKDGDGSPAADASEWNKSKCSESILLELVKDGLLHDKDVVFWRAPELDLRPLENPGETTLFQHLTEHGLALPASNFFQGLLGFYGIQIQHLPPNSILHISIFVHF